MVLVLVLKKVLFASLVCSVWNSGYLCTARTASCRRVGVATTCVLDAVLRRASVCVHSSQFTVSVLRRHVTDSFSPHAGYKKLGYRPV